VAAAAAAVVTTASPAGAGEQTVTVAAREPTPVLASVPLSHLPTVRQRPAVRELAERERARRRVEALLESPPRKAICAVFRRYCRQALAVARCESHLRPEAQNGQYLGLFQMGLSERRLYGHGATPYQQAVAAHRYFLASGRDWSPWTCKPWW
jgi:hypothetical protein